MKAGSKSPSLLLFYILVGYILLQFGWWAFQLYHLNTENLILINAIKQLLSESELNQKLAQKKWMVIGEGFVFLVLMIVGVYIVRKSFLKQGRLARQQNNFLLSVTHELKTPIAANRLIIETLQRTNLEPEKVEELLGKSVKENQRLDKLVSNILISTQADNDQIRLELKVETELERLAYQDRPLKLNLSSDSKALIDEDAFSSIIINLIENADKYSEKGKPITVSLNETRDDIYLDISDEGIGIAMDERQEIFQKFYRIGNETTRTAKGTGLGLFIVKRLVELQNGQIEILDNNPCGTTFRIRFKVVK